jgi:hypothetical protein
MQAPPASEARQRLIGALIDTYFESARALAASETAAFVPLDEGLAVMSRHAQTLGYDAVVLFLDELILWLASQAADLAFVNREGQKIAKLVEAMSADRPIPIVSFIARQRDLRELVGDHLPGAEQLGFADVLNWWQARFDTITLEDRNLPAIVEKRLLRPKSARAAFETAQKLYRHRLLPMLEQEHGVTAQDVRAGGVEATRAQRFRADNRLVKTLILSSLAEGVEALRVLTPSRLA